MRWFLKISEYPHQKHRRCGMCGRHVSPWKGSLKCDGWHWHRKCWIEFLTGAKAITNGAGGSRKLTRDAS